MNKLDEELKFVEQDNWPFPDFKKGFPETFRAAKSWEYLIRKLPKTPQDLAKTLRSIDIYDASVVKAVIEALEQYNGGDDVERTV